MPFTAPTYASKTDQEETVGKKYIIQMSDDEGNGQSNTAICNQALSQAESIVNASLSKGGYVVPVALPIPQGAEIVVAATVWLSICVLASRRGVIAEDYKKWCDFYMERLEEIESGELTLPLPVADRSNIQSTTLNQEKKFSRSKFNKDDAALRNPDEDHTLDTV